MDLSRSDAPVPAATDEYRPGDASIGRLPVEIPSTLRRAADDDLRLLLYRRLRFLCSLLAVVYGLGSTPFVFHNGPPGAMATFRLGFCCFRPCHGASLRRDVGTALAVPETTQGHRITAACRVATQDHLPRPPHLLPSGRFNPVS